VVDEVLADALMSLTYAVDVGNPDGTMLLGGNVSRRHDFGFVESRAESKRREPWLHPAEEIGAGAPWHVRGSLLGLDLALASSSLRRIDAGEVLPTPVLTVPDRNTFAESLALLNPWDLDDRDRDAISAAIARGRARLDEAVRQPGEAFGPLTDEVRLDGWRRRAVRWAAVNEPPKVTSYFSLAELATIGGGGAIPSLDRWGTSSNTTDACLCLAAPAPGGAILHAGRPQTGEFASQVADLHLHAAEALAALHLPAQLARGVLSAAVQDYVDGVHPLHPSDWLTLVRTAQAIPTDRVADYVGMLTADGTLAVDRPSTAPAGGR